MKKITALLTALVLALTLLSACGGNTQTEAPMGFIEISDDGVTYDLFVPDDNLFAPDDGLFNADFREPSYTPASRRRLPLTLEEGPGLRSSAYGDLRRRRHSSSLREDRTEPSLRRSSAKANRNFHIEDNPLNRRRPQNGSANPAGYPAEDSSDDREMW